MAAVGELILSALLRVLFHKLASGDLLNFARQLHGGLDSELKDWEPKFRMINAVLRDVENKLMDGSVKGWLDNLQDLAYDVEDILDEFAYEALRRKMVAAEHQTVTSKARNLIPSCFTGSRFNANMVSKIKEISKRLDSLCNLRVQLGLQVISGETSSTAASQRRESSSVATEQVVYGRAEDKAKILKMVLSDKPSDGTFRVITIVGMGGIGKTTLARKVYNDKAVNDSKFDIKAWLCVSDNFDVLRISKELLMSIDSSSSSSNNLNEVQVKLKDAVNGKKFLLVLDDVWHVDYNSWVDLKSPFMAGACESIMIVTTRLVDLASTIRSSVSHRLNHLSNEHCWDLFLEHAFGTSTNVHAHGILDSIRKRVVERCGGLPLAAKTLGGLLGSKQIDAWGSLLNSEIWDSTMASNILPVLNLSYHHLPSHLKRCFAYCAIFPKDYEFEEKELVLLWTAEGIVQPSKVNMQKDVTGECFCDLLSRSLLQQSSSNTSKYIMHDLVHDLAESVLGEIGFRLEQPHKPSKILSERTRHFSYVSNGCDGKKTFEVLNKFETLRTFLPVFMSQHFFCHITAMVLLDLLPKFKKLRTLSLRKYKITELPDTIGDLIHLRYLNFSETRIRSLPESTSSLFHLQILLLRDCSRLVKLPSKMRHLSNLCHLDIKGVNLLKEMPSGMNDLQNLLTLSNFIVGNGKGSRLRDLENLSSLKGELHISKLENVINSKDLREHILIDKKDLEVLLLEWRWQFYGSRVGEEESHVLNMLQPHENLKEFTIMNYGGARFPPWIENLSNMRVLKLQNCRECTSLPTLGLLGSLKHLTVQGFTNLRRIGSEIYGECHSDQMPFPSLEILCLEDLQECEFWDTMRENEDIEFPHLRELSIRRCPKLIGKLPDRLPSLESLVIEECADLEVSFSSFSKLCKIKIDECKEMVCGSSSVDLKSLNSVTVSKIPEFENLTWGEKPQQWMHSFNYVKELVVGNCTSLILFPEVNFLCKLSSLTIQYCKSLKSLPEGIKQNNTCLERLAVIGCDSLTFIATGTLPSSFKRLDISSCRRLQCVVDDRDDHCTSSPSSSLLMFKENFDTSLLEYLYIENCPSLTCISKVELPRTLKQLRILHCSKITILSRRSQLPKTLEYLSIWSCHELELIAEMFDDSTCLRVIYLHNLKFIPKSLHNLSCLETFEIGDVAKLEALPNDLHSLNSLQALCIDNCPDIVDLKLSDSLRELRIKDCASILFPEGGLPTSLTKLSIIGNHKFYKTLIHWGLHKLTSLTQLSIHGCGRAVCFPEEEMGMILPTSLTKLEIFNFPKLKYLGLQSLTSLERLRISECPKLISFAKMGLPSSLLQLNIDECPLLQENCERDKGKEWLKIANIPSVHIDGKFIYNLKEKESAYAILKKRIKESSRLIPGLSV